MYNVSNPRNKGDAMIERKKKRKLSKDLTAEIIDELGGVTRAAELLGAAQSLMSYYRKTGFNSAYVNFLRSGFPHLASVRKTYDEF